MRRIYPRRSSFPRRRWVGRLWRMLRRRRPRGWVGRSGRPATPRRDRVWRQAGRQRPRHRGSLHPQKSFPPLAWRVTILCLRPQSPPPLSAPPRYAWRVAPRLAHLAGAPTPPTQHRRRPRRRPSPPPAPKRAVARLAWRPVTQPIPRRGKGVGGRPRAKRLAFLTLEPHRHTPAARRAPERIPEGSTAGGAGERIPEGSTHLGARAVAHPLRCPARGAPAAAPPQPPPPPLPARAAPVSPAHPDLERLAAPRPHRCRPAPVVGTGNTGPRRRSRRPWRDWTSHTFRVWRLTLGRGVAAPRRLQPTHPPGRVLSLIERSLRAALSHARLRVHLVRPRSHLTSRRSRLTSRRLRLTSRRSHLPRWTMILRGLFWSTSLRPTPPPPLPPPVAGALGSSTPRAGGRDPSAPPTGGLARGPPPPANQGASRHRRSPP